MRICHPIDINKGLYNIWIHFHECPLAYVTRPVLACRIFPLLIDFWYFAVHLPSLEELWSQNCVSISAISLLTRLTTLSCCISETDYQNQTLPIHISKLNLQNGQLGPLLHQATHLKSLHIVDELNYALEQIHDALSSLSDLITLEIDEFVFTADPELQDQLASNAPIWFPKIQRIGPLWIFSSSETLSFEFLNHLEFDYQFYPDEIHRVLERAHSAKRLRHVESFHCFSCNCAPIQLMPTIDIYSATYSPFCSSVACGNPGSALSWCPLPKAAQYSLRQLRDGRKKYG